MRGPYCGNCRPSANHTCVPHRPPPVPDLGRPGGRGSRGPGPERYMRVIETALVFDQVQGGELAALELVARAAQLIELRHRDMILGSFGISVDEDAFLYLGVGITRGLMAVSPRFEDYVASELSKETATLKERRKTGEKRSGDAQPKMEPKGRGKGRS